MTGACMETPKVRVLDRIPCTCYPVQFRKDKGKNVVALLNSGSEINAITSAHAAHLGFKVRMTNVSAHKIDKSSLATYSMVIAVF